MNCLYSQREHQRNGDDLSSYYRESRGQVETSEFLKKNVVDVEDTRPSEINCVSSQPPRTLSGWMTFATREKPWAGGSKKQPHAYQKAG